jgi:hypothetical protein
VNKMIRDRILAKVVLSSSLPALGSISYGQDDRGLIKTTKASISLAQAGICNVYNVAGWYGYSSTGFVVVANPFGTPPVPITQFGTFVLDTDGTFTITKFFTNINGSVLPGSPVTGTFVVNSDCTINATNQFGFSFFGVFVDNRKEIRYTAISGPEPY